MSDATAIFTLAVEDVQRVAKREYNKILSQEQMEIVRDNITDYLDWYDAVMSCIENEC